jgi:hypothetical protein
MSNTRGKRSAAVAQLSKCPPPSVLDQVAALAKVPKAAQESFSAQVIEAIEFAHQEEHVGRLRPFSRKEIAAILDRVSDEAGKLYKLLESMKGMPITRHVVAGQYLKAVLIDQRPVLRAYLLEHHFQLRIYVDLLHVLARAAETAVSRVSVDKGSPRGTRKHAAFDLLVWRLLIAARHASGKLSIYKSAHSESGWAGALLKSVDLLRPYLPPGFLPKANWGKSLYRIAKESRQQINPQK